MNLRYALRANILNQNNLSKLNSKNINITYPCGIKVEVPMQTNSIKLAQLIINIQKAV